MSDRGLVGEMSEFVLIKAASIFKLQGLTAAKKYQLKFLDHR
jgi:hypothetical protein